MSSNQRQTCQYYLQGRCHFGSQCKYLHPSGGLPASLGSHGGRPILPYSFPAQAQGQPVVCPHFLRGACFKGADCSMYHAQHGGMPQRPRPPAQPQHHPQPAPGLIYPGATPQSGLARPHQVSPGPHAAQDPFVRRPQPSYSPVRPRAMPSGLPQPLPVPSAEQQWQQQGMARSQPVPVQAQAPAQAPRAPAAPTDWSTAFAQLLPGLEVSVSSHSWLAAWLLTASARTAVYLLAPWCIKRQDMATHSLSLSA